jgi:hypothetical protein
MNATTGTPGALNDAMRSAMEIARAASVGCPECDGSGFTSRYIWEVRQGEQREVSVGAICHRCDAGRYFSERRNTGDKGLRSYIDLNSERRQNVDHEIFKYDEATRLWLAERDGYCNPRDIGGNQATAWWEKYKARLARANKERKHAQRIPASQADVDSSVEGEAGRTDGATTGALSTGGNVVVQGA